MRRGSWHRVLIACAVLVVLGTGGCGDPDRADGNAGGVPVVLADTTFMADIAQNIAGDRLDVSAILPAGADPHSFQPTPQDAKRIAESSAVIVNAAGLVPQLDDLIKAAGSDDLMLIEAAEGLPGVSEDPHTWLDPLLVVEYAKNIAEGLAVLDPAGAAEYQANAEDYSQVLMQLDAWIRARVETVSPERRLLVTNHESLRYFAERYGFRIVGTVFPTTSGEGSPSAQQLAALVEAIKTSGAPAIFLETGSNAALATQIARETGAEVVADLQVASLGDNAPSYVDMMRWNVDRIVGALR